MMITCYLSFKILCTFCCIYTNIQLRDVRTHKNVYNNTLCAVIQISYERGRARENLLRIRANHNGAMNCNIMLKYKCERMPCGGTRVPHSVARVGKKSYKVFQIQNKFKKVFQILIKSVCTLKKYFKYKTFSNKNLKYKFSK